MKWLRLTGPDAPFAPVRVLRSLGIATVAVGLLACGGDDDDSAAASAAVDGVIVERVGDYSHLLGDLDYDRPAPSGGDHPPAPYWLTCGVYDGDVPDELAVHSLEHGAVWIALGPDSTDADRAAASELAADRKVIVSDVPDLPNPVEAVAWGVRLPLESADDPRLSVFVDSFIDASTGPEAGLSCQSVGTPPNPPTLPTS